MGGEGESFQKAPWLKNRRENGKPHAIGYGCPVMLTNLD